MGHHLPAAVLLVLALAPAAGAQGRLRIVTETLPGAQAGAAYLTRLRAMGGDSPYTWAITDGTLPPGVLLSAATGIITGIPTRAGSYSFTVRVRDDDNDTARRDLRIAVAPERPLAIATTTLAGAEVNRPYTQTLAATGGAPPYQWRIAPGSLPNGLSLVRDTGVIGGTPASAGSFALGVEVSDTLGARAARNFTLAVAAALAVTTTSLASGAAGASYVQMLTATGGAPPYAWSIAGGVLPPGLALTGATIAGTPTTAGTFRFTVRVADTAGAAATRELSIVIAAPALEITTASLASGNAGIAYTQTLAATGGTPPYAWSVTAGVLPAGLALTGATIAGTPTTAGTFRFTVRVADTAGATATRELSIVIAAPALEITTASLASGNAGIAYTQTLAATGGTPPYAWSVTAGVLPAGLALTGATIAGTPTAAGTFRFTVRVADAGGAAATRELSIVIATSTLEITTTSLAPGNAGIAYSQTLSAAGGTPPYAWSVTGGVLPAGLALTGATIAGTPTTAGTFRFTVRVADSAGAAATRELSITIAAPALEITATSLPPAAVGAGYSQTLSATGGTPPYTWSVTGGALPAGLALTGATIAGVPTAPGTAQFAVQARDAAGVTAGHQFLIVVRAPPLEITTSSLAAAETGAAYAQPLAVAGGTPPYAWSAGGTLPPGLALEGSTISGTPTAAGSFSFTVDVADAGGQAASRTFTLAVRAALAITTASLPDAAAGTSYSQTLAASGGTPPYTWSIASGALPEGITLNAATGRLSGVPRGAGTSAFTVQVRDNAGRQTSRAYRVNTAAGLVITTAPVLPGGVAGSGYDQALAAAGGRAPYTWSVAEGALPAGLSLSAATGRLAGTPTASGVFEFTARVADNSAATATKAFTLSIAAGLVVSTAPELPNGGANAVYAQPLSAAGGVPPYTWSITAGALPPGLRLEPGTGLIAGTPAAAGTFSFTARVTDSLSVSASKDFSLRVHAGLTVTSAAPPGATLGAAYTHRMAAAGGAAPYSWTVSAGGLPPGLALDPTTGVISGTPAAAGAYGFTVQLQDAAGLTASAGYAIAVELPPPPEVSLTGGADQLEPLQQPAIGVSLAAPFPAPIEGEVSLSFEPDAAVPADDPAIQFSTGGRRAAFLIPPGSAGARFAVPTMAFQTGTVAGTIRLVVTLRSGDTPLTPEGGIQRIMRVPRSEPKIRALSLERSPSGFEARVTGLATGRELESAVVTFQGAPGSGLETTELTVPLAGLAERWYADPGGAQFGSQFLLTLPFTVNGDLGAIDSVTVRLVNQSGVSQPATARF